MKPMVEQPLRLCDGKFMRGNVEVAPEIGNKEQIELLRCEERKANERERLAKNGELEVVCRNLRCKFICACGHNIEDIDIEALECCAIWPDGIVDAEKEVSVICPKCGRVYEIDGVYAKLIEGPNRNMERRIGLQNQTK